jgi:hypothetical protein
MSNPKKHDSGAPEGGRWPTEDALESSAAAGRGRVVGQAQGLRWPRELLRGADLEARRGHIALPQPPSLNGATVSWPVARLDSRAAT